MQNIFGPLKKEPRPGRKNAKNHKGHSLKQMKSVKNLKKGCGAKFIADMMHGNLARWLRIMGCDCIYGVDKDSEIIEISKKEDRTIITSDKGLAKSAENVIFIPNGTGLREALLKIVEASGIEVPSRPGMRCPICNGMLVEHSPGRYRCTNCGKEYWEGSHWRNIKKVLEFLRANAGQRNAVKQAKSKSQKKSKMDGSV